jgi:putative ABC transport system permease protein
MTTPGPTEVALGLVLVAIAMAVARWWKLPVIKDITIGTVRSFVQLIAVGYALHYLFDLQSLWMIFAALLVMIVIGSHAAASGRVKQVKGAFGLALAAIFTGSFVTLATMLMLGIVTTEARYLIPLAGMIVGNSVTAAALSIDRLGSDLRSNRHAIETALALGMTWREASASYRRDAAQTGMISILNFMKTVGLVALPGAMTGMILAGAEPLEAVLLQLIVAYMLLSATTITSVVATELTVRRFFTTAHQMQSDT